MDNTTLAILVIIFLIVFFTMDICLANDRVDMKRVMQIESSGNPNAYNPHTKATGLYQLTPVVVADYNDHYKTDLKIHQLYDPELNTAIAYWYMNQRIQHFLNHYEIKDTIENRLIAWHDGIGNLRKYIKKERGLGKEMQGFLKKYWR